MPVRRDAFRVARSCCRNAAGESPAMRETNVEGQSRVLDYMSFILFLAQGNKISGLKIEKERKGEDGILRYLVAKWKSRFQQQQAEDQRKPSVLGTAYR
jgi:hypothetical protein